MKYQVILQVKFCQKNIENASKCENEDFQIPTVMPDFALKQVEIQ